MIASFINFGEQATLRPVTEIRYGYGMKFTHTGTVLHGLNKYSLILGLKIPDFTLPVFKIENQTNLCYAIATQSNNQPFLHSCLKLWPVYLQSLQREQELRSKINYILEVKLPAIIPNYQIPEETDELANGRFENTDLHVEKIHSGTKSETNLYHHREKRFIGLILHGLSYLYNKHKFSKIRKGMKMLAKGVNRNSKKIHHLREDLITVTEASLKEFEFLRGSLFDLKKQMNEFKRAFNGLNSLVAANRVKIDQNQYAIIWVANMVATLTGKMEHINSKYEQIIVELYNLMDALDNLSTGHLSHHAVSPEVLKGFLAEIKTFLKEYHPDYELVTEDIVDYYNMNFNTFGYENGTLAVEVPIFLKPRVQEPLLLYQVETVPVPYHINPDLAQGKEKQNSYTWIRPEKPLLAMSTETYLDLLPTDLNKCLRYGNNYLCEEVFLMKHKSLHSCSSAIYWNADYKTIMELCNIKYYTHLVPKPQILDGGDYLLLAGLPQPWSYHCIDQEQIPTEIKGGPYAIIHKSQLCMCSLLADNTWFIQGNMKYCDPSKQKSLDPLKLYHTVNMAVMMTLNKEELLQREINDTSLFPDPLPYDPEDPNIITFQEDEVLETDKIPYDFKAAVKTVGQGEIYGTKQDKAIDLNQIDKLFTDNGWLGFAIVGSFIACIAIFLGLFLLKRHFQMANHLTTTNGSVSAIRNILTTLTATKLPQPIQAVNENTACDSQAPILNYVVLLEIFLYAFTFLVIIKILYELGRYIHNYLTYTNLTIYNYKITMCNLMFTDKSDIYVLLTSRSLHKTIPIYVGSYVGLPDYLTHEGYLRAEHIWYKRTWVYNSIMFNWNNYKLKIGDKTIQMPDSVQIPMLVKFKMCYYFGVKPILCQLVTMNDYTKRSKTITSLCTLRTKEPDIEIPRECIKDPPEIDLHTKL